MPELLKNNLKSQMTAVGATAVGVTAVRNDHKS